MILLPPTPSTHSGPGCVAALMDALLSLVSCSTIRTQQRSRQRFCTIVFSLISFRSVLLNLLAWSMVTSIHAVVTRTDLHTWSVPRTNINTAGTGGGLDTSPTKVRVDS